MSENRLVRDAPALMLVCLAALAALFVPVGAAERPNVVLLMGDDHGWEETGYNGHAWLKTPVLDAMAGSGLRLDRFYAAHPSCSPTRGSVLTGRHPVRYDTFAPNWSIRPEEITIAHLLRDAGYATGHFGKWHVGPVKAGSPTNPGAMGFDEWLSHDNFFEMDPVLSRNGGPPRRFEGESSAIVVEEAIRFIDRAARDGRRFLAVVWFGSPHEPNSGLEEDLALYDGPPAKYADRKVRLTSNETGRRTSRSLGDVLRERYAEITAMDRAIGRLRDHLEATALRENTLFWYISDNGTPPSGLAETPLRGLKSTMYEGGIRVPAILEWPARITGPRATDVPAVTSDILPTLAALAGQPLPDRPLDGVDLEPLIDGRMTARPAPIFFWKFEFRTLADRGYDPYIDPALQIGTTPLVKLMKGIPTRTFRNFRFPAVGERDFAGPRVIMDRDYKLVVDATPETGVELFHLGDDRAESRNLTASRPAFVAGLERRLRDWQRSVLSSLIGADYGGPTE